MYFEGLLPVKWVLRDPPSNPQADWIPPQGGNDVDTGINDSGQAQRPVPTHR